MTAWRPKWAVVVVTLRESSNDGTQTEVTRELQQAARRCFASQGRAGGSGHGARSRRQACPKETQQIARSS
jgi:hypothetical protein